MLRAVTTVVLAGLWVASISAAHAEDKTCDQRALPQNEWVQCEMRAVALKSPDPITRDCAIRFADADQRRTCIFDARKQKVATDQAAAEAAKRVAEAPLPGVRPTPATCSSTADSAVPPAIIKAILTNNALAKSQFETTADYERRIQPIIAKLSPVRITFGLFDIEASYDADKKVFTVAIDTLYQHFDRLENFPALGYDHVWLGHRIGGIDTPVKYRGAQNVYGAKFKISKFTRTNVEYIFAGADHDPQPTTPITFPSPQRDPQLVILKVVLEGNVVAPYYIAEERHDGADFYDRRDITARLMGIPVALKCGSIIDAMSGKVLATFDLAAIFPRRLP